MKGCMYIATQTIHPTQQKIYKIERNLVVAEKYCKDLCPFNTHFQKNTPGKKNEIGKKLRWKICTTVQKDNSKDFHFSSTVSLFLQPCKIILFSTNEIFSL